MFSPNGREYGSIKMQFVFKAIDALYYGSVISGGYKCNCFFPHGHAAYKFCILTGQVFVLRRRVDDVLADAVDMFLRMNIDFSSFHERVLTHYYQQLSRPTTWPDDTDFYRNENLNVMRYERKRKLSRKKEQAK